MGATGRHHVRGGFTASKRAKALVFALTVAIGGLVLPSLDATPSSAAPAVDNAHCANGAPLDPPVTCADPTGWQNGDVHPGNSHYVEGNSIPGRAIIATTVGEHRLRITYEVVLSGGHAFDYLTSFDRTETTAVACSGTCVAGTSGSIPVDPATGGPAAFQPIDQLIKIWNGDISSVAYIGTSYGPSVRSVEVTFTAAATSNVVIAWGAHLARSDDWGAGMGASSINGAPFHVANEGGDVSTNKQLSVQIEFIPPPPTIATQTSNATVSAGDTVTDTATFTGHDGDVTGTADFFLCGPSPAAPDCSTGGTQVGAAVPLVVGAGSSTATSSATPALNAPGFYCFRVAYTPDNKSNYVASTHTNTTTECVEVQAPSLSLTKTTTTPSVSAGDQINYTLTVSNSGAAGTGTAAGVHILDTLPTTAGLSWTIGTPSQGTCGVAGGVLDCDVGTLAPGASASVTITSPTTSATCSGTTNSATATTTNGTGASAGPTPIAVNCPGLSLSKTTTTPSVSAGSPINYTLTVSNSGAAGTGTAAGVHILDTLPTTAGLSWTIGTPTQGTCGVAGGVLDCDVGTLAPGASASVTITSPTTSATCPGTTNSATATTTNGTGASAGPTPIAVNCPSLSLSKTTTTPSVSAGDPINYTLTVSNSAAAGTGTATGVQIVDTLPTTPGGFTWTIGTPSQGTCAVNAGVLTCDIGTLAPGGSASVTITANTTSANCGTVSNRASATATNGSGAAAGPTDISVLCALVGVVKTADAASVVPGDVVGFTVTVSNSGLGEARGVSVVDTLPTAAGTSWVVDATSGLSCGAVTATVTCAPPGGVLAAGASASFHVSSPTTAATAGSTLTNSVSVSTSNDGSAQHSASVKVLSPSIAIVKSTSTPSVSAGDVISYLITVSNPGDGEARGVTVSDALPSNPGLSWTVTPSQGTCSGSVSCALGTIAGGGQATISLSSPTTPATCGTVANSASVSTSNDGSAQTAAPTVITVNCPTVGIVKTADASPVSAGDKIGYTVTVSNTGAGTAHGVSVTDTVPTTAGTAWTVDSTNGLTCSGTTTVTCTPPNGALAGNTQASFHLSSPTTPATCGTVSNTASVVTSNDGSASSTADISVLCALVGVVKTADAASVVPGDVVGFTVTVSNSGLGEARGVSVVDTLPTAAGTSWVVDATSGLSCGAVTATVTCAPPGGVLAAGASASFHVSSPTTAATAGSTLTNSVSVSTSNDGSAQHSASVKVLSPSIAIVKSTSTPSVSAGDVISYLITVSNPGDGEARGVTVSDALPSNPGLSWTVTPSQGTCSGSVSCALGTIAGGGQATISLSSPTTPATCGTVANSASVSTSNDGSAQTAAPTVITVNCPHLQVTKSASATPVSAGDTIGYTITVTNQSTTTAAHGVVVTDSVPTTAGTSWTVDATNGLTCSGTSTITCSPPNGDLAPGASASFHVSSPTTAASCGTVTNKAVADASNSPNRVDSDPATITVNCPNIGAVKTTDTPAVDAGGQIRYKITVTNSGAGVARNVTVSDALPTNGGLSWTVTPSQGTCTGSVSCALGTIAAGGQATISLSSPTTTATCGSVSNSASVSTSNDGSAQTAAAVITVNCPVRVLPAPTLQRDFVISETLPRTGMYVVQWAWVGIALLGVGLLLVLAGRRRRVTLR